MSANPQPPTLGVGAPLDTSSPATQIYSGVLPSPYQIVYRPGAIRGTTGVDVRGPICGTFPQVEQMMQSVWMLSPGGQTFHILFDGNDPANSDPNNCHIPTGAHTVIPADVWWEGAAGTAKIICDSGCTFPANWMPKVDASKYQGNCTIESAGGGAPFTVNAGAEVLAEFHSVQVGDGTNPVINVVATSVLQILATLSVFHANAIESTDATGLTVADLYLSCEVIATAFPVANTQIDVDASCTVAGSYAADIFYFDQAFVVGYTPTTPGNWGTIPTQVGQALDVLAASTSGAARVQRTTATTAAHPAMVAAAWQYLPLDSTAGPFTQPLPPALTLGQILDFTDFGATSAANGIATNPVTLDATTAAVPIQNPHTMVVQAGVFTYVFGGSSQDGGGASLSFQVASNASFAKFLKVINIS